MLTIVPVIDVCQIVVVLSGLVGFYAVERGFGNRLRSQPRFRRIPLALLATALGLGGGVLAAVIVLQPFDC